MGFLKDFIAQFDVIASTYIIRAGLALIILAIGYFVVKILIASTFKLMKKLKMDDTLQSFLKSLSTLLYYIVLFMIVLTIAGVPSTYFAGMLVGLGTAIGFGLRDEFKTVSNGIIILMSKPYKVGDAIKTGDNCGVVMEIKLFHTIIRTFDNLNIVISNGTILSNGIIKLSDTDTRRQDILIDVSYEDNIEKVKSVLSGIINKNALILKEPAPIIAISSFEDSSVRFLLRLWSRRIDFIDAKFTILEDVKNAFDKENISMPFQQHDITIKSAAPLITTK
ncbi:MAG TPA: mechanosensitive ion channel protein MscS [Lentisphaeria bacterium]|nr:MAG: hypothetical protein A2X47_00300 [Lentisphaerae bacterium GWF2_38_69]HBM14864.1 mechanosensitive ion channel protein MscS [Lentisphaeria bacterium]